MIKAGLEMTSAALNSAILYLSAHPEVQNRAHEEIMQVVGEGRSPKYEDETNLPYIRALGKEILRIRPVTTIGSPHYTTADVRYKGFYVPKNTVVCMSQYALHSSPEQWEAAQSFDPPRYLDYPHRAGVYAAGGNGGARDHFDFGAGRRICPGMHLAENSLYITLAKLLWAFSIAPGLGPDGEELPVNLSDAAYGDGINTLPRPFKARFIPRSETIADVLRVEWEQAKRDGFYYLGNEKVDTRGNVVG